MGRKPAVDRLCLGIPCGEVRVMLLLCSVIKMHLTLQVVSLKY